MTSCAPLNGSGRVTVDAGVCSSTEASGKMRTRREIQWGRGTGLHTGCGRRDRPGVDPGTPSPGPRLTEQATIHPRRRDRPRPKPGKGRRLHLWNPGRENTTPSGRTVHRVTDRPQREQSNFPPGPWLRTRIQRTQWRTDGEQPRLTDGPCYPGPSGNGVR